ncbi:MAG TPA: crosslink repair DNA glycosylase YcaQ family protein [Nitrososphaerales archaeon]|nr:crosslink repair DNA glycosylase YcaQ family protein [Nitrososphaerales archaeon]
MIDASVQDVRRIAIIKQHLDGTGPSIPTRKRMYKVIQDLTYLQIDPISVVARSPELVLWSRLGNYKISDLNHLLWKDRALFEYFAHAASIVLSEDYPIHSARMRHFSDGTLYSREWHDRVKKWIEQNSKLYDHIIKELSLRGPLLSRDIEDLSYRSWKSSGWTNERNVNRMLEFLLVRGEVMVQGRSGIQKFWDLAERCLPSSTPKSILSDYEVDRLAMMKSLRALGIATKKQIMEHFSSGLYSDPEQVLNDLEREGEISKVMIHGLTGGESNKVKDWYIHSKDIPILERVQNGKFEPKTTLLSPFDNLIIDRKRTLDLFGFEVSFEIYVPKPKRRFGYYVLSILHGDRIIGRIDPKMDRDEEKLLINSVHAEPNAPKDQETVRMIKETIERLAGFLGARQVSYSDYIYNSWKNFFRK